MAVRTALLTIVVVALAGCDRFAGISLRGQLTPAPSGECIAATLATSPSVARILSDKATGGRNGRSLREFRLELTGIGNSALRPTLYQQVQGDSTWLDFTWLGRLNGVPSNERLSARESGLRLLRELRAACAPSSDTTVSCREGDLAQMGSCGLGR
jgi:hypothetical protein